MRWLVCRARILVPLWEGAARGACRRVPHPLSGGARGVCARHLPFPPGGVGSSITGSKRSFSKFLSDDEADDFLKFRERYHRAAAYMTERMSRHLWFWQRWFMQSQLHWIMMRNRSPSLTCICTNPQTRLDSLPVAPWAATPKMQRRTPPYLFGSLSSGINTTHHSRPFRPVCPFIDHIFFTLTRQTF